ncbi:MAG: hypothetical protein ACI9FU_001799 [Granulosicoccus sp.]|jgi:hypothetical protein
MINTFTLSPTNPTNRSEAEMWLELNDTLELICEVEAELETINYSPDATVVDRILSYSKAYAHADSKLLVEGIGVTLN